LLASFKAEFKERLSPMESSNSETDKSVYIF
jgi:hypothetical protein